jgi:hypothetical protein
MGGRRLDATSATMEGVWCPCELTTEEVVALTLVPPHPASISDEFAYEAAIALETVLDLEHLVGFGGHVFAFTDTKAGLVVEFASEHYKIPVKTSEAELESKQFGKIEAVLNAQLRNHLLFRRRDLPYWALRSA